MGKIIKIILLLALYLIVIFNGEYEFDLVFYFASVSYLFTIILGAWQKNKFITNGIYIIALMILTILYSVNISFFIGITIFIILGLMCLFYFFYYFTYKRQK